MNKTIQKYKDTYIYTDDRTNKTYYFRSSPPANLDIVEKQIKERAEHDYQMTLRPENRSSVKEIKTEFNCPYCKTMERPTPRKVTIINGSLFFVRTDIVDIYICGECNKEFEIKELDKAKTISKQEKSKALIFEKFKSGEITRQESMLMVYRLYFR